MNYQNICKYIFSQESLSWERHEDKTSIRPITTARYISYFIGNFFYPTKPMQDLVAPYHRHRTTAYAGIKVVKNLMETDKNFNKKITRYLKDCRKIVMS